MTFNSQYAIWTHNLNKNVCAQITEFYRSGGYLNYIFTVQNNSLQSIVIYVRRTDGVIIPDGTVIDVNITVVEPEY